MSKLTRAFSRLFYGVSPTPWGWPLADSLRGVPGSFPLATVVVGGVGVGVGLSVVGGGGGGVGVGVPLPGRLVVPLPLPGSDDAEPAGGA